MFRFDGPLMRKLTKLSYILYVHILAFACFIPIITAGAGMTALEYVLLKISRDEDADLTKNFFRSFKENFKHGTVLWLIYLAVGSFVLFDLYFLGRVETGINQFLMPCVCIIGVLLLLNMTWGFVLLSRYNNSALKTLRYSFSVCLIYIGRTILMLLMVAVPLILGLDILEATPYMLVFGPMISGYFRPILYSKVFERIEKAGSKDTEEITENTENTTEKEN